ncbi:hypothetical protein GOP47_0019468, partial [Adiantum capillus-veneris]
NQDKQRSDSESEYKLVEVEEEVEVSTDGENDDAGVGGDGQEANEASQHDLAHAEDLLGRQRSSKLLMESLPEYSKDPLYAKHFELSRIDPMHHSLISQ